MGGRRTREGSMKNTGGSARSRMGQWGEARLHNRSHARRSLHLLVKIRSRSVLHVDFRLRLAVVPGSCRLRQAGTEHDAHQDGCRPGFDTRVRRSGAVKQGWRYERSNWRLPRFTPGSGGVPRSHHQLEESEARGQDRLGNRGSHDHLHRRPEYSNFTSRETAWLAP